MPRAAVARRHVEISKEFCRLAFRIDDLHEVFRPPRLLPPGWLWGLSVSTDGVSVSFQVFKKLRAGGATISAGSRVGQKRARPKGKKVELRGPTPPKGDKPPRPRKDVARAGLPLHDQPRVVAVDAGSTWIVKTAEFVWDAVTGRRRIRVDGLSRAEWRNQRGDDDRLAMTAAWCAHLSAPGGAFDRLRGVSGKTASSAKFRAYSAVAHGTRPANGSPPVPSANADILAEKLKLRWADAKFRTWLRGKSILHGFWARIKAGRYEDGTAGVDPTILYGNAHFDATGRGRRSAPTTMRRACLAIMTTLGVREADEHRSSMCCATCGHVHHLVDAPTPDRVYASAAARAARGIPTRPVRPRSKVRGLLFCANRACPAFGFHHRDTNAAINILLNALYESLRGEGRGLAWMTHDRRAKEPARWVHIDPG